MNGVSREFLERFAIAGQLEEISELKRGHINTTFLSRWRNSAGVTERFVHQQINQQIFTDTALLMRNIFAVTDHLRAKYARGLGHPGEMTLSIIRARDGSPLVVDEQHGAWRTYRFVEETRAIDFSTDPGTAFEAAGAFGRFLRLISDLPSGALGEPIPHFQDLPPRFRQLDEAIAKDRASRRESVSEELNFVVAHRRFSTVFADPLAEGRVPLRPTHADPKINNVLFSERTGRAVCVVDLDTCMPGTVLWDFGDLARSTAVPCAEDEQDFGLVTVNPEMFEAVSRGYLAEVHQLLTPDELSLLSLAPAALALNLGVRFLTDHLNGDTYFRVHHAGHNLERARTQFQIFRVLLQQQDQLQRVVERCARR